MKTIILNNKKLEYQHRRLRRSRRVRLAISSDAKISITTPLFFPEYKIKDFLLLHANWILEKVQHFENKKEKSIFPNTHKDYLINKSRALKLVRNHIAKLNAIYNFKYNKVTIKNTSSRWGSCSRDGNLNFNYKMIYLSEDLSQYVVAHELCHLKEMNHGQNFWKLVASTIPHWKTLRKQLKNIS